MKSDASNSSYFYSLPRLIEPIPANIISAINQSLKLFNIFDFLLRFIGLIRDYKVRRSNSTLNQNVGDDFDIYNPKF